MSWAVRLRRVAAVLVAGLLGLLFAGQSEATPSVSVWPTQLSGPAGHSSNPYETTITSSTIASVHQVWHYTHKAVTAPVAAQGVVVGTSTWLAQRVFALSAASGTILWQHYFAGKPYLVSEPAIAGNLAVVGISYQIDPTNTSALWAFDLHTGRVVWRRSMPGEIFYRGGLDVGGRLYVNLLGGHIVALNAATGALIWSRPGDFSWASGADMTYGAGRLFVWGDGMVAAISATTGKMLWGASQPGDWGTTPPIVVNGRLVMATRVDATYTGFLTSIPVTGCGQLACQPTLVKSLSGFPLAMAYQDGRLFLTIGGPKLLVLDPATFAVRWRARNTPTIDNNMTAAGDLLYIPDPLDGVVKVFRQAGCGQPVCKPLFQIPGYVSTSYIFAGPVITSGTIYLTDGMSGITALRTSYRQGAGPPDSVQPAPEMTTSDAAVQEIGHAAIRVIAERSETNA